MNIVLARDDAGAPEIFRSIQGEGPHAGRLRTFVRLSGCNLHCLWCDTAYTWNWEGTPFEHERDAKFVREREAIQLSVADTCAAINALRSEAVVITGGEPLMQRAPLLELASTLKQDGFAVEIETNGSIAPSAQLASVIDLFVVSPKLAHSGNDPAVALKAESLRAFAALPNAVFKVVARTGDDIAAAARIAETYAIASSRVYIMPEGVDAQTLSTRAQALAPAIIAHGFNFSPRLHIEMFGQKRGV